MTDSDDNQDTEDCSPVEQLAEQYLDRLRSGERPRISEYADAHPDLADEIRDVFRTLAMLEDFAPDHRDDAGYSTTLSTETPTRLGDYRIVRELGRGGMGVVYEAEHGTMRRRVALKVLHTRAAKKKHDLERFLREARSAGRLHHTNIVPVFEVGVDEDTHFYAMQCIRGQNLDLVIADLKRLQNRNGHLTGIQPSPDSPSAAECLLSGEFHANELAENELPDSEATEPSSNAKIVTTSGSASQSSEIVVPEFSELSNVGEKAESYFHRVARVGLQVADALAHAHEHGVLHRDIKPSNLILDTEGTIWVTDFGLAWSEGDNLTHTGDIVGTLRYMAPERFRGEADARSDLYSLGLSLYELCTLKHAFDRTERPDLIRQVTRHDPEKPRRVNPLIPRDLETIILKCIDREPNGRYTRAEELREDLHLFLADRPIDARRSSLTEQSWRWCRRNPFMAALMSCIVALLGVIFFGAIGFALHTGELNEELTTRHNQAKRASEAEVQARADEQTAYAESRAHLYESLFRQAQAERRNQLTGRRDQSLDALQQAVRLLSELHLSDKDRTAERLRLRNEAVAILGQSGIAIDTRRTQSNAITTVHYDRTYERYVQSRGNIEIRDVANGDVLRSIPQHRFRATDVLFSDDGRFLATIHRTYSSKEKYVRVWDLQENRSRMEAEVDVSEIRFAPNSQQDQPPSLGYISGPRSATVHLSNSIEAGVTHEFAFDVKDIVFVGEEDVAVVGDVARIEIWSVKENKTEPVEISGKARSVNWSHRTNRLVVGLQNGNIDVYDLNQDAKRVAELKGHTDDVYRISMTPDCEVIVSRSWDSTTRLWDVRSSREMKRLEDETLLSGFSLDGRYFSCGNVAGETVVYELFRNAPKHAFYSNRNGGRNHAVAFHPQSPRFAAVATGNNVEFWDLKESRLLQLLKTDRTFLVKFSPDGKRLLTSGRRGLRVWKLVESDRWQSSDPIGSEPVTLVSHDTHQVAATPDLSRIAFADEHGIVSVVNASQPDSPVRLGLLKPRELTISPDGRWVVATSSNQRGLVVRDAVTGEDVVDLGPNMEATSTAFSPDSSLLVGANPSRQILWNTKTWEVIHEQQRATRSGGVVAFTPDGKSILMPQDRFRLELVSAESLRPLVALDAGERRIAETATFSPTGTRLGLPSPENFDVWDLQKLRQQLQALDLDW